MDNRDLDKTLAAIFYEKCDLYGLRTALFYKDAKRKVFHPITWLQWKEAVRRLAFAFLGLGIRKNDRVGILSENRPEWTYVDLASLSIGAVSVPVYPTSSCEDIEYIIRDAGIKIFCVSTRQQYARIEKALERSDLAEVVLLDEDSGDVPCRTLQGLQDEGRLLELNNGGWVEAALKKVSPDDLATLIYTSGTTGPPKGVMLTHRNFIANCVGAGSLIDVSDKDVSLSFLPLSHVFERLAGYYFMAFHGAQIAYAESMQTVPEDLLIMKPTVAASVPRLYEKIHARIHEAMQTAPKLRRRLFAWALRTGRRFVKTKQRGVKPHFNLRISYAIARLLVFNKLKRRLGGRIRFFISGGAPLSKDLAEFFFMAGVLILEGYGLTETSPVIAVNSQKHFCFGTVGRPLPNVEVRIAGDGEILTRSPCVMKGYFRREDATREVIDGEGWFHTGDIGKLDEDGYLSITDRKKDIIVTSGGKNISPQNIEQKILSDDLFQQAVVIGDKRNYLVALLFLDRIQVEKIAREENVPGNWPGLLESRKVHDVIAGKLSETTAGLPRYEQIKYFRLLPTELSQEGGELTPTLKVKRKVVMDKYRELIESMYQEGLQWKPKNGM